MLNLRVFHFEYIVQDRYLYLPSIGFCYLVAILIARLAQKRAQLSVADSSTTGPHARRPGRNMASFGGAHLSWRADARSVLDRAADDRLVAVRDEYALRLPDVDADQPREFGRSAAQ